MLTLQWIAYSLIDLMCSTARDATRGQSAYGDFVYSYPP